MKKNAKKTWLVVAGAVVALVLAVVVGTAIYAKIENDKAPDELALTTPSADASNDASDSATLTAADLDGAWSVGDGSQAGYRVDEVLNGQNVTVVGRTTGVTGSVTVADGSLTAAEITVDMISVTTDNGSRDRQFLDILSTGEHPTATFTLTSPVDVSGVVDGVVSVEAKGDLTIAGVTQPVTVALQAQATSSGVEVSGTIPVTFSDYDVQAPNLGFVQVEDAGTVEMLLQLSE